MGRLHSAAAAERESLRPPVPSSSGPVRAQEQEREQEREQDRKLTRFIRGRDL